MLMMNLVKPQKWCCQLAALTAMVQYRRLAEKQGFEPNKFCFWRCQEVLFTKENASLGQIINTQNVYVDRVSAERLKFCALGTGKKLATDGNSSSFCGGYHNGQIDNLDVIVKGLPSLK